MFPEKLLLLHLSILFSIITDAHSVYVRSPMVVVSGGGGGEGFDHPNNGLYKTFASSGSGSATSTTNVMNPSNAATDRVRQSVQEQQQQEQQMALLQDMPEVDSSNRLSNVNRISHSPLLMLPSSSSQRHQIPMFQQQHRLNPGRHSTADSSNLPFAHANSRYDAGEEEEEIEEEEEEVGNLFDEMMASRSRLVNHNQHHQQLQNPQHQRHGVFGEMRVLGHGNGASSSSSNAMNSRHREPHYGTVTKTVADSDGHKSQRGHVEERVAHHSFSAAGSVPYKHQEQFLNSQQQQQQHRLAMVEQVAQLGNHLPPMEKDVKKRTESTSTISSSSRSSASSSRSEEQKKSRLNGPDPDEAATAAADSSSGPEIHVSKKNANPFLGDSVSSMIPHSIASQLMLRSARGQRQYDVPQIGE